MRACLKCGFVHEGEIKTRRYNIPAKSANRCSCGHPEWNGVEHYTICPDCGEKHIFERVPDKEE